MNSKTYFYELGKLIYQIDNSYEEYGKKSSITSANLLWILYALNDGNMHTQKSICDDWKIPRSTANTIIKELEEKKLISLSHLEGTRREMVIYLTDEGKLFADKVLNKLYEREKKIYDKLPNKDNFLNELKNFVKLLSILNED